MLTRPRRDSSSSLAAATELKAKKDEIGESSKPRKEVKKEKKPEYWVRTPGNTYI